MMIKATFVYTDGTRLEKVFATRKQMEWFEFNEGDHLNYATWELVDENYEFLPAIDH